MGGAIVAKKDKNNYHPMIFGNLNELLPLTIVDASICFFSMDGPINYQSLVTEVVKKGLLHHSGVILEMSNGKLVLLEYGAYPKNYENKNENENNYYYPLGNGFRYSLIDKKYIWKLVFEKKTLFIINSKDLTQFGSWCVEVKVRRQISLKELFDQLGNNWTKGDYNVFSNNCQHFTVKVINILDIESRFKSWYNRNMKDHKIMKTFYFYISHYYAVSRELAKRITNYNEDV